jgi:hypothetical protein
MPAAPPRLPVGLSSSCSRGGVVVVVLALVTISFPPEEIGA